MLFYGYYTFDQAPRGYFFGETDPNSFVYISQLSLNYFPQSCPSSHIFIALYPMLCYLFQSNYLASVCNIQFPVLIIVSSLGQQHPFLSYLDIDNTLYI